MLKIIGGMLLILANAAMAEGDSKAPNTKQHLSGWFYGAFGGIQSAVYEGMNDKWVGFPVVGYRGEKLQWLGPRVSYQVFKSPRLEAKGLVQYRGDGFEAKDSDIFQGMADRDDYVAAGVSTSFLWRKWFFDTTILRDISSASEGTEAEVKIGRRFELGPVFVSPRVEVSFWDNAYMQYYYGVPAAEANMQRSTYSPGSSLSGGVGMTIATPVLLGGFTRLVFAYRALGDEVKRSPLVDKSDQWRGALTFSRYF